MPSQNAVAAIRVSTAKQGFNGDSPEAQKEQIERFATTRGITIKGVLRFLELASKELQPMQQAINYCKDPKNDIQFLSLSRSTASRVVARIFIARSRISLKHAALPLWMFTASLARSGLTPSNTWACSTSGASIRRPGKHKLLEAERANDEMRDIMSRMIGAEVRYTRMGFWMRQAPYGLKATK